MTIKQLKEFCRDNKIASFSTKTTKESLVNHIIQSMSEGVVSNSQAPAPKARPVSHAPGASLKKARRVIASAHPTPSFDDIPPLEDHVNNDDDAEEEKEHEPSSTPEKE
jgi:hypothetical protein